MQAATALDGDRFAHPALFYRGEDAYLAGTLPFVRDGLAAGDPVAVAVPRPNLSLLRTALGDAAQDVLLLDMSEVGRNPGRILAEVLHAAADRHPDRHVRIIGEPIWPGRTTLEYPACVQHEALINLSFRGRHVTVLCPYDAEGLDAAVLADAAQTHPLLIEDGGRRASSTYAPERAVSRMNTALPEPPARPFDFDASLLGAARRIAAAGAEHAGLSEDRVDDFVLGIGELTANSIQHGGGRGTLHVWVEDGMLAGEVRDSGRFDDPLAGRRRPPDTSLGGRGLQVVHHIADLVRTHVGPHGTTTRLYLRLGRPRLRSTSPSGRRRSSAEA
ncbi:sensor histidine kinase [Pseudonocardia sp. MH-G8]|uniref:sensor histidine kinase n=1 Tax=Pseudonocardia sp. MH-G8 TaxID=1854588 RepID=UPI000BA0C59B|nr:sensor histidine kinase [Pseudonocardia sp. MH-G8]OZM78125.1 anti-sigma regulatory factor [Pseudonocardia sp. MH-G8]